METKLISDFKCFASNSYQLLRMHALKILLKLHVNFDLSWMLICENDGINYKVDINCSLLLCIHINMIFGDLYSPFQVSYLIQTISISAILANQLVIKSQKTPNIFSLLSQKIFQSLWKIQIYLSIAFLTTQCQNSINNNLLMQFYQKEVVWAKVKGYPWWPAYISKLPQDSDGNFKVIFFAEDTYALLQPKCIQKFAENYSQYSKTKAKKFLKALEYANNSANSNITTAPMKKSLLGKKKQEKNQEQQQQANSEQGQQQQQKNSDNNNNSSQSEINNEQLQNLIQYDIEQIDRKKIQKLENELSQIITAIQSKPSSISQSASQTANTNREWKYSRYFETFLEDSKLNSQQILHSNLTRKIKFIIQTLKSLKIDQKDIQKLEKLSMLMKNKVIQYLTDTTYYDQHLRVIDKNRHNKAEIQSSIVKIMRKKYQGHIKKQFINILAGQIGAEVGKNPKFQTKQLLSKMKQGQHDEQIRLINSKAATQRLVDKLIAIYRQ